MKKHFASRRYLIEFDSRYLPSIFTEVLVVGSGVAGLRAAIEAAQSCSVLVVTKAQAHETNTDHAQGGVAVVLAPGDTIEGHIADTVKVGQGLCEPEVVTTVVSEGPSRIEELIEWGAQFDTEDGALRFAREGGHRTARVLHANGDSTGHEIESVLLRRARAIPQIQIFEQTTVIDLLSEEGRVVGALVQHEKRGLLLVWAGQVVLATGGAGQLYRETTNPAIATADGLALAYRAGAELQDLEFFQFHPTTLYVAGASRALISEAMRGEGAVLTNRDGERFMPRYHPDTELAPRDVVSRSILAEMRQTGETNVYLDVTHIPEERLRRRFPRIWDLCAGFDIRMSEDPIPVRPSAHYAIGGVKTDLAGRSSLDGLLVCGEAACTGLHGANRLASNSLLEGLVFGQRAGDFAREAVQSADREGATRREIASRLDHRRDTRLDLTDLENSLRSVMWRRVGIEREEVGLAYAEDMIDFWSSYVMDEEFSMPRGWRLQNMLTACKLICHLARERTESRGVHYRLDYPDTDDARWRHHSMLDRSQWTESV